VVQRIEEVKDAFRNFADEIVGLFSSIPARMVEIGQNIISGLWDGIKSKWDSVKNGIADLGSSMVDSIKSRLGIFSPSAPYPMACGRSWRALGHPSAPTPR
jgi:phage-related protein